jgi:hypothetical protein
LIKREVFLWYNFLKMESYTFLPPKRLGFYFQLGAILVLIAAGFYGFYQLTQASLGPAFLFAMIPILLAVSLTPPLVYRMLSLANASYILQRDGITLQWGQRIEEIPMTSVLWVRPASELRGRLPLPWFYWPGSVIGIRRYPEAGQVEFMASTTHSLLLIGTPGQVYAISPDDRQAFLAAFNRLAELGSLTPISPRSIRPSLWISHVWSNQLARWLILVSTLFSLALLVWVSFMIPRLSEVSLGFQPDGSLREPVPAVQLMLLPVVNSLIYVVNLVIGLAFFRQDEKSPLAFLLWGNMAIISGLFFFGLFFIL